MRLFPHTWEGLHPAYPKQSTDSESCLYVEQPFQSDSLFMLSGEGLGVLATACLTFTYRTTWSASSLRVAAFVLKTTVFATGLGIARSINNELAERRAAPVFLRCQHIEPPTFSIVDRLDHWDSDNWSVFGGVAGFLAARKRCPLPTVNRPIWFASNIMAGIMFASQGFWIQEGCEFFIARQTEHNMKIALQKASYQPEVVRECWLNDSASLPAPFSFDLLPPVLTGDIKISPEMTAVLIKRIKAHTAANPQVEAADTAAEGKKDIVDLIMDFPNESDAFHKTYVPKGELRPFPYAARNYDWSGGNLESSDLIRALEEHISALREQRRQTHDETEALHSWLSECEAEYYKLKEKASGSKSDRVTEKLVSKKRYLENLARWHLSAWKAVSECDWMIAGATHRLALQKNSELRAPRSVSDRPQSVKLKHMLRGLDAYLKASDDISRMLRQSLALNKRELARAVLENVKPRYRAPIKERIEYLERSLKGWATETESARRVFRDAEERSKSRLEDLLVR
jgi:hypothetical protein